jgi:hypothetical protein
LAASEGGRATNTENSQNGAKTTGPQTAPPAGKTELIGSGNHHEG